MKTVFIAHRISGDVKENIRSALRWARWALIERQVVPVLPYAYLCQILDDGLNYERKLGLECSMEVLMRCEEVWTCGPRPNNDSEVWKELAEAERMNKRIINYLGLSLPPEYANFTPAE